MKVGILSLQGAIAPHREKLAYLGAISVDVRTERDLENLSGIILPGGESTTMLHLLKLNRLWAPLKRFALERPTWGVCAGTILMAKHVTAPDQESLELMDLEVERNAYGRQIDSFITQLRPEPFFLDEDTIEGVFIRAPRIRKVGSGGKVLVHHKEEPVMVVEKNWLASTFHPELSVFKKIHEYFLKLCRG